MKKLKIVFGLCFISVLSFAQNLSSNTTGSFIYTPASPLNQQTVEVFYHIPNGDIPTMPIMFSFHGANRDGDNYRDYWISMANTNGFMVFAPEFSDANYPGGDSYQLANIFDDGDNPIEGTYNPQNEWTFSVIDPLFNYIKADISGVQQKYNAWGHSGGAQFLHRFVMYMPNSNLDIAVCSNSGWYTVPESLVAFPYGTQNGQLSNATLTNAFAKKLIVHLGQDDINPNSAGLRHNMVVDNQQGFFRLERGQYFYTTSQATSINMSVSFNWEKQEVAGIGHNAQLMANDALQYISMNSLSNESFKVDDVIKVFPNPTDTGFIKISASNNADMSIKIYDVLGKLVKYKKHINSVLNISDLKSGIYIMKINQNNITLNKKLVIN